MDKDNIIYIGLFLNNNSQEALKDLFKQYLIYRVQKESKAWKDYRVICHHMTIAFNTDFDDEILNWSEKNEGKKFDIFGYEFGYSDKAIALKVRTKCPSKNKLKHITIAVNNETGGNAVDSNYIKNWFPIDTINLKGEVSFFKKNNS